MKDVVLSVDDLGKRFTLAKKTRSLRHTVRNSPFVLAKEKWALRNISFEVTKGEVVGIIGSNGAGKSTLLKVLSGIVFPTEGRYSIKGTFSQMLELGTGFYPDLTGRENIYLSGAILGMDRRYIDTVISDIIDFAEIGEYIDHPIRQYSSGMYVRLGFSIINFLQSDILAIDEVMAVGDHYFRQKCRDLITSREFKHNKTVLVVSHDLQMIEDICERCLLLEKGKLIYDGASADAVDIYLNSSNALAGPDKSLFSDDLVLESFKLTQNSKSIKRPIKSGSPLTFRCILKSSKPRNDLICKLSIRHESIGILATLDNVVNSQFIQIEKSVYELNCLIDSVPFGEGRYFIDIELRHKSHSILTGRSVLTFDIQGSVLTPSNRTTPHYEGAVQLKSTWSIDEQ